MAPETLNEITTRLDSIEQKHGVKILYACESGSRAWGFSSSDSDYDVRFIYVRPLESYLTINEPRDVIEEPIEYPWDFNGWDVKKALGLLYKSNPTLLEWINSPIHYRLTPYLWAHWAPLIQNHWSPNACMHHYSSMAKSTWHTYFTKDTVDLKKYFYVIRPLLACYWLATHGTYVPVPFEELFSKAKGLSPGVVSAINHLLVTKRSSVEEAYIARVQVLDDWIVESLNYFRGPNYPRLQGSSTRNTADLDREFRRLVCPS